MTEDIPLEITSNDMANLPIFIAVLIVAAVVVRVYFDRVGNVGVSAPTADRQTQAAPVLESGIAT